MPKGAGAVLCAGSINGISTLTGASNHPASDTALARIIRMVGEAQHRRAPVENLVDRFARIDTLGVMVLALAVRLLTPLLGWGTVCMVLSCPGAPGDCLPLCARYFHLSEHRVGACLSRPLWRNDQGGCFSESPGPSQGHRLQ